MTLRKIILLILTIPFLSACSDSEDFKMHQNEATINQQWREGLYKSQYRYKFLLPQSYEKGENASEVYPLIIGLHGMTTEDGAYYAPYSVEDRHLLAKYPAFVLAPSNTTKGWGEEALWVIDVIQELIKTYPVDTTRIYLIGFSMGGSGSFEFSENLYNTIAVKPAAIIRIAGRTQHQLISPLRNETAIWYHYGLQDSKTIKETAARTFHTVKKAQSPVEVKTGLSLVSGKIRRTRVINKENREWFKLSAYFPMGHSPEIPAFNEEVVPWLFSQQLKKDP